MTEELINPNDYVQQKHMNYAPYGFYRFLFQNLSKVFCLQDGIFS